MGRVIAPLFRGVDKAERNEDELRLLSIFSEAGYNVHLVEVMTSRLAKPVLFNIFMRIRK